MNMNRHCKTHILRRLPTILMIFFVWGALTVCSATLPINKDLESIFVQTGTIHIRGFVIDSINQKMINDATIICLDYKDSLLSHSISDVDGSFGIEIPIESFSILVTKIGYDPIDIYYQIIEGFHENFTVFLNPTSTYAGKNQLFKGNLAKYSLNDITLMNEKIALKIECTTENSTSISSGIGNLVDFCSVKEKDGFEWLKLPIISKNKISGFAGSFMSDKLPVKYTSVNVQSTSSDSSVVVTQGRSLDFPIDVFNTYSIYPNKDWIIAKTSLSNTSNDTVRCWIGDALNNDENGQTSLYPNAEASFQVVGYRDPFLRDYRPTQPWMGCFGTSNQVFGIFYDDDFGKGLDIAANTFRIISQKSIVIPPHGVFTFSRKLVAIYNAPDQSKILTISNLYKTITDPNRIETSISTTTSDFYSGKTNTAIIKLTNLSNTLSHEGVVVTIKPPLSIKTSVDSIVVPKILPGQTITVTFDLTPTEGIGNCNFKVETKSNAKYMSSALLRMFVPGKGWYTGEGHSHSYYSDGLGSIYANILEAKAKGLSFMHCTDHNTIAQLNGIRYAKPEKFLAITGSEVTTYSGHALSLFCDEFIPWKPLQQSTQIDAQQIIDNINKAKNGTALSVICHPYQFGYTWRWTDVVNVKGYEVYNWHSGFRSHETELAFNLWDKKLKEGKRVYGYGNSDAHIKELIGETRLCVQMNNFTENELYTSTKSGHFYSTNGPELRFSIDTVQMGDSLIVPSKSEVTISMTAYSCDGLDSVKLIKNGELLKAIAFTEKTRKNNTNIMDVASPGDYYRMEVIDKFDRLAFSNPIFIADSTMLLGSTYTKEETIDSQSGNAYLYPNPATDALTVYFGKTTSGILSIYDVNGVVRYRTSIENSNKHELNVSTLSKGIYQVQLNDLHLKLMVR